MSCLRGPVNLENEAATETELSGTRVGGSPTAYPAVILTKLQSLLKRRIGEHNDTDLAREIESSERHLSKCE